MSLFASPQMSSLRAIAEKHTLHGRKTSRTYGFDEATRKRERSMAEKLAQALAAKRALIKRRREERKAARPDSAELRSD